MRGQQGKGRAAWFLAATLAAIAVTAGVGIVQAQTQTEVISGRAHVVDGDTMRIGEHRIRIWGIGTPAKGATCQDRRLDRASRDALRRIVGRRTVECRVRETDRNGREHAVCTVRGRDIAQAMVQRGWARDWPRHSCGAYAGAEARARQDRLGAWRGACVGVWGNRDYSAERCSHLDGAQ